MVTDVNHVVFASMFFATRNAQMHKRLHGVALGQVFRVVDFDLPLTDVSSNLTRNINMKYFM